MIIATLLPPTWTGTFFDTTNSTVLLRRVYVLPKTSEILAIMTVFFSDWGAEKIAKDNKLAVQF